MITPDEIRAERQELYNADITRCVCDSLKWHAAAAFEDVGYVSPSYDGIVGLCNSVAVETAKLYPSESEGKSYKPPKQRIL